MTAPVPLRMLRFLSVLLPLLCALSVRADTPKPEVKSVEPAVVAAGQTITVTIYGENLSPKMITLGKAGPTAKLLDSKATEEKLKAKGSRQVTLQLTVPTASPREALDITLVQPDGAKVNAQIAVVDPVQVEADVKKPAATYAQAMPVPGPSAAIRGQLDGDQPDVFKFDAKAGEVWIVTCTAGRMGSMLDPVLRIRDRRHVSLALSAGDKKKDRRIEFHVPTDGTYYIELTEGEAKGGAGYNYRITVNRR